MIYSFDEQERELIAQFNNHFYKGSRKRFRKKLKYNCRYGSFFYFIDLGDNNFKIGKSDNIAQRITHLINQEKLNKNPDISIFGPMFDSTFVERELVEKFTSIYHLNKGKEYFNGNVIEARFLFEDFCREKFITHRKAYCSEYLDRYAEFFIYRKMFLRESLDQITINTDAFPELHMFNPVELKCKINSFKEKILNESIYIPKNDKLIFKWFTPL